MPSQSDEMFQSLVQLISGIEDYRSPFCREDGLPSPNADSLCEEIIQQASWKTAAISATCSLPGGPIGFLTILPELIMIFRVQGYLVKDIAAIYGKDAQLTKELLLFSLFKNGGAHLFRKFVEETSVKILIRPATVKTFQTLLEKVGLSISRRILRKNLTRWVPLAGAVMTGGFTFFDTTTVGRNAKEIFSKEIIFQTSLPEDAPSKTI